MANPLISVVVTCYNQAAFLGEALDSVLSQTYSPVEIIVVDDGSTDDTPRVAASRPDVRCVRQANQGLSAARNTGLRVSRGEFIAFLDADDRLLPRALAAGQALLAEHPQCHFVYGHYRFVAVDGTPLPSPAPWRLSEPGDHYRDLLQRNFIGMHATVLYRRAALVAAGGFNKALRACEDYDVYLRITGETPVCSHREVVAEYRRHEQNMSCNTGLMLRTSLGVLRSQRALVRRKGLREAYRSGIRFWSEFYGEPLFNLSVEQWRAGQRRQALAGLATLLRQAPAYFARRLLRKLHITVARRPRELDAH
jgi:glycosyltransferase involved in cell wall biosynthesis